MLTISEEAMSPAQAARRLGVSTTRVRQLLHAGALQGVTTALGHLIDPAGVEALVESRRARATEPRPEPVA